MTVAVAALAVVVVLLSFVVAGLLRSHADILRRLHELEGAGGTSSPRDRADPGPAGGAAAHDVSGVAPDGTSLALRVAGVRHDSVLLFLSTRCVDCEPFWDALAVRERTPLPDDARLLVVAQGPDVEDPDAVARLASSHATVVLSSDAWTDYDVPGSPFVVHVDGPSGTIRGRGSHASWDDLARMLRQAAAAPPGRGDAPARAAR